MSQVKKISIAKLCGKLRAPELFKEGKTRVLICTVVGIATGTKHGVSDYGEWTALIGSFRATSKIGDEKTMDSPQLFMPDVAQMPISAALEGGANMAEFAVGIIAVEDEESATGYVYECENLAPSSDVDPLDRLMHTAGKTIKALADKSEEMADAAPASAKTAKAAKAAK